MLLGPEFRWVLDGFTPDTIPMARLAEYMQQLSKLFGHEDAVHFVRVEKSSVALVSKTDRPIDGGKVEARVSAVARGTGTAEATRAFQNINNMLAEDGTTAALKRGTAVIIRFPGRQAPQSSAIEVQETGSVVGYLYMLYQLQDGFHARLRLDSRATLQCSCSTEVLSDLKDHLFARVRVSGNGRWRREADGVWHPTTFTIARVVAVQPTSLREVVDNLRDLEIPWPEDPLGYLAELNEVNGALQ